MSTVELERVYRGRSGAERSSERRDALVDAALDVLSESGSAEFGMRVVCRRAGLSARYFYESFADRDELLLAAFDTALGHMRDTVESGLARDGSLTSAFAAAARLIDDEPRIGHVLFREPFATDVLRAHAVATVPVFFLATLGSVPGTHLDVAGDRATLDLRLTALSGALINLFLARTESAKPVSRKRFAEFCVQVVHGLTH